MPAKAQSRAEEGSGTMRGVMQPFASICAGTFPMMEEVAISSVPRIWLKPGGIQDSAVKTQGAAV